MKTKSPLEQSVLSRFRRRLLNFCSDYNPQKIAGKLNLMFLVLMALIVVNSLIVCFSLYVVYTRRVDLFALQNLLQQVDQVESSQLRFRLSNQRKDALSTLNSLNRVQSIFNTLPPKLFDAPDHSESVKDLIGGLDSRFNEYLLYQEQVSSLESGMRKTGEELLASMQKLKANTSLDPLSDLRAQLVQSVLEARIIQQEFSLGRDMSLTVRMEKCVKSIIATAGNLRAQSKSTVEQIEAYNIGQQALLLDSAFVKLRDYTKIKMTHEQSMTTAAKTILQRVDEAATRQRASISSLLFFVVIGVLSASLMIIAAGFLFGRWFVRKITGSLTQLLQISHSIAYGDYSPKSLPITADEFGELATSFNDMANTVTRHINELQESEQRVLQRTNELEMANESLAVSHAASEALNVSLEAKVLERTLELEEANLKLSELTVTDALTGLFNRRRFDQVIAEEWMRASRTEQSLAILMIDVDNFKAYNDHYGHLAGDECLRKVAHVLQACARRASDLVARYGGEEFVVVAADMEIQAAQELAETFRRSVEALAIAHEFSQTSAVVTISIGVSVAMPNANMQPESLLRMADAAMYYAKDGGRNRVAAWDSRMPDQD